MKALVWLLLAFAAAVAIAVVGRGNDGYVLFVYPPWRMELSIILFGVLAVAGFVACYALARLVHHTLSLPVHVRTYRQRRRKELALSALASALQSWFEGRYARAEKEAGMAYAGGVSPGLAALIGARAAHELRQPERRDMWLERARASGDTIQAARLVTQAELALAERDFAAARDALHSLHGAGPRHIATMRMLLRAERGAQNWPEVLRLATALAKRDAIPPAAASEHKVQAQLELLSHAASDRASFESAWRRVPDSERQHPRLAAAAARHATALGLASLARGIVERSLQSDWNGALATLYAQLPSLAGAEKDSELRARIEQCERWLRQRPDDPQLLAALGGLCAQAGLWGKAHDCLEASVAREDTRAARLELAKLAERLERSPAEHYRRAAELP
jgi:HemY protein